MKYFVGFAALLLAVAMTHAQWSNGSEAGVPAFHSSAPVKGETLPPLLTQKQLDSYGLTMAPQRESYKAAALHSALLYQLPCYCYCDRNHGHKSLRSCFEGTHGANCGTCIQEALYAHQMSRKGWTARQIRDGVIRGDFKLVDLQNPERVK